MKRRFVDCAGWEKWVDVERGDPPSYVLIVDRGEGTKTVQFEGRMVVIGDKTEIVYVEVGRRLGSGDQQDLDARMREAEVDNELRHRFAAARSVVRCVSTAPIDDKGARILLTEVARILEDG